MKSKTQCLCHVSKKLKRGKKNLVYVCTSVRDGGAKKRTRTLSIHYWWQLQVKRRAERAIERPRL